MKHTHGQKCRCTKCYLNLTVRTDMNKQDKTPHTSADNWKDYDAEFANIVAPLQVELRGGKSNPSEVASELNTLLTNFLSSKPNIIREVKTCYRHKPTSLTNLNDARKLKNELEKKSLDIKTPQ